MAALALGASSSAEARDAARRHLDIDAGTLAQALAELAREAHVSIGTQGPLPELRTHRVRGEITVEEALSRLLAGSGYVARQASASAWRIERAPVRPNPPLSASPPPETVGEPIMVTATKQPLDLLSAPVAVAVVRLSDSGQDKEGSGSAVIAARLEGLALTSLGPGRNRMFLRGVADSAFSGESQSTVAVVLDEARLTYAAPDPDIRLVDMDRVEVLKGPQGSLYGTGALGGIYRMVLRPVDLAEGSLTASAGGSAVLHGSPGHSLSAVANLPLARDTLGVRLTGYRGDEPGWIDTGARDNGNSSRVSGARGQVAMIPADGWRIDFTGFGQWLSSRDSHYAYAREAYSRPAQLREPHDNDLIHLATRVSGQIGEVEALLASAITWHDVNDAQDATIGAGTFGLANPQVLGDQRRYRTTDSELRLRGDWGNAKWLAGLALLDARQRLLTTLSGTSGASLTLDDDLRDSHDAAAYLDITVPLASTLSLDAGGRLFRSSIRETRVLPTGAVTRNSTKSGMTPGLALAWQPRSSRLVYLRYGGAFRQGGSDITASGTVETLRGDELSSIEAGWREGLGRNGRLELSAWYSRWENIQSDLLETDGLIETANVGNAAIFGAEASLELSLGRHWRLEAGANFTDAKLVSNALGYELDDRRLPVVPEYTLRASLRHGFELGPVDAWARLGLRRVGPSRMSFDPAIDRRMGSRTESEAELHLSRDWWQFDLAIQNLLGDQSNVFALGNSLRYRSMPQFTAQQPTTVTARLTVSM